MYFTIMHLLSAIVLLLWAVRMVRTAVERAYSAQLKRTLAGAERSAVAAAAIGAAMAVVLQSSTAVSTLVSSLASAGLVVGATGLSLVIGGYLGSAIVANILSFDLSVLMAPLIVIGGIVFLRGTSRQTRQLGRLILGVAFVLLSLEMVAEATAPWRDSDMLSAGIAYLQGDLWTGFFVAALVTWLSYSSVASILVIITFGATGVIPLDVASAMVLGANLGGTLIALGMTRGGDIRPRRIAIGALVLRGGGALTCLVLLQVLLPSLQSMPGNVGQQASALHIGFNLLIVVVGLPLTGPLTRLLDRLVQPPAIGEAAGVAGFRQTALNVTIHGNVDTALASAVRELLRMGEIIEVMLQPAIEILKTCDKAAMSRVNALEPEMDRANSAIKLFLSKLRAEEMDGIQTRRASELSHYAVSLEHAADIIADQVLRTAGQLHERRLTLSTEGWSELIDLHARVMSNLQLALNVLVSEDIESARRLVSEKDIVGALERKSIGDHFTRLRAGNPNSFETSELHLGTIRALRHINSLICGIAYSTLSEDGDHQTVGLSP